MRAAGSSDLVAAEVEARLAVIIRAARERGEQVLAPLLILGTSERVGSNWVSDTLRPVLAQHNEPFRQQLGPDHPWSALNPRFGDSPAAAHGGLGRHWLVSFAVAKYGLHRQVVKETNLFFALPALLSLLPEAPVLVLSRCPLGVASSFIRGDLFRRWGYRSRYQQMLTMTRSGLDRIRGLAALVPDDDPPDLVALVRLQVLNTLLIAGVLPAAGLCTSRTRPPSPGRTPRWPRSRRRYPNWVTSPSLTDWISRASRDDDGRAATTRSRPRMLRQRSPRPCHRQTQRS